MREIKFRTYDVISESFVYYTLKEIINWLKNIQNWVNWEHNQYTWLKDKNWKEIYEGDIIRTYHIVGEVVEKAWSLWIMGNPQDFLSLYNILDRWDFHKVEIIWNIYENPNLINND